LAIALEVLFLRQRVAREESNPRRFEACEELPIGDFVEMTGEPRPDLAVVAVLNQSKGPQVRRRVFPLPGRAGDVLTIVVWPEEGALPHRNSVRTFRGVARRSLGDRTVDWYGPLEKWRHELRASKAQYLDTIWPMPSPTLLDVLFAVALVSALVALLPLTLLRCWGLLAQSGDWSPEGAVGPPMFPVLLLFGMSALPVALFCWTRPLGMPDSMATAPPLMALFMAAFLVTWPMWRVTAASKAGMLLQAGLTGRARRIPWSQVKGLYHARFQYRMLGIDLGKPGRRFFAVDPEGGLQEAAERYSCEWALESASARLDNGERLDFDSVNLEAGRVVLQGDPIPRESVSSLGVGEDSLIVGVAGEAFPRELPLDGIANLTTFRVLLEKRWGLRATSVARSIRSVDWKPLAAMLIGLLLLVEAIISITHPREPGLTRALAAFAGGGVVALAAWAARLRLPEDSRRVAVFMAGAALAGAGVQLIFGFLWGGEHGLLSALTAHQSLPSPLATALQSAGVVLRLFLPGVAAAVWPLAMGAFIRCPACGRRWPSKLLGVWSIGKKRPHGGAAVESRDDVVGRLLGAVREGRLREAFEADESAGTVRRSRIAWNPVDVVLVREHRCSSCGAAAIRFTSADRLKRALGIQRTA
jgi:hypothetical protein